MEAWKLLRAIRTEREVGLYEVLDFEHTLELCDAKGKKAMTCPPKTDPVTMRGSGQKGGRKCQKESVLRLNK